MSNSVVIGSNTYVFKRNPAGNIYYDTYNGIQWLGWQYLAGNSVSDPSAVALGNDIWIFVRSPDNVIWYNLFTASTWTGWISLEGSSLENPEAVVFPPELYVFVSSADGSDTVYFKKWDGISWNGWYVLI